VLVTNQEIVMEATKTLKLDDLVKMVAELTAKVEVLETKINELTKPKSSAGTREMTDDDARRILTGDLKDTKHKEAAEKLGLSYGQIYSCRLEFTFKHIHKEMRDKNIKNAWVK
jgi:outer membrane murein-binding lipoprotein Lpp